MYIQFLNTEVTLVEHTNDTVAKFVGKFEGNEITVKLKTIGLVPENTTIGELVGELTEGELEQLYNGFEVNGCTVTAEF